MDKQERINTVYSCNAQDYDSMMNFFVNFEGPRKTLFRNLNFNMGERVLDMAVGTGLNLKHYPDGLSIVAIDNNRHMAKYAFEKAEYIGRELLFSYGDATNLPFKENSFDKAIITYGLSAIPKQQKVLEELHRVVKPEGHIGVVDFSDEKEDIWKVNINLDSLLSAYSHEIISQTSHMDLRIAMSGDAFRTYVLEVKK